MEQRPWHRCLGAVLVGLFPDPDSVQPEKDLSIQQQRLDFLIRLDTSPLSRLPDGLDNMAQYNLLSFKSHKEALDEFTLDELVCSFVIVRKLMSESLDDLLALDRFRRYAICVRTPRDMFARLPLPRLQDGVYEGRHFSDRLRVIVINELPLVEHNAPLLIFSSKAATAEYGALNYNHQSGPPSALLSELLAYRLNEDVGMNKFLEDIERDVRRRTLESATIEERLRGVPVEERLKGLAPEERLKGVPTEERLKGLAPEERLKGLAPEERLKGLSPEELAHLARLLSQALPPAAKE